MKILYKKTEDGFDSVIPITILTTLLDGQDPISVCDKNWADLHYNMQYTDEDFKEVKIGKHKLISVNIPEAEISFTFDMDGRLLGICNYKE